VNPVVYVFILAGNKSSHFCAGNKFTGINVRASPPSSDYIIIYLVFNLALLMSTANIAKIKYLVNKINNTVIAYFYIM